MRAKRRFTAATPLSNSLIACPRHSWNQESCWLGLAGTLAGSCAAFLHARRSFISKVTGEEPAPLPNGQCFSLDPFFEIERAKPLGRKGTTPRSSSCESRSGGGHFYTSVNISRPSTYSRKQVQYRAVLSTQSVSSTRTCTVVLATF